MAKRRYRIGLNNARFPLVSTWQPRAVSIPSLDTSGRQPRQYQGSDENIDFNIPQILYGENFVPVANGVKSVSYAELISSTLDPVDPAPDFDQIFPLRDAAENQVLYSPAKGKNWIFNRAVTPLAWRRFLMSGIWNPGATTLELDPASTHTLATARVTRGYVDGRTIVCYSRLLLRETAAHANKHDGSLLFWNSASTATPLTHITDPQGTTSLIRNLPFARGEIDGVAASNGYLLVWSNLRVAWAPFDGTAFNFQIYANGEVTGAGSQIPEDVEGPITAIIPVSGGYIIFTDKNAVAAFYNANNFASPWIFKRISNAGGIENYELCAEKENKRGQVVAYTSGGLQAITLNSAEPVFSDVSDFLGGHYIERFETGGLTFEAGEVATYFDVKLALCGNRFLTVSYGTLPGIFSFALVYDYSLDRWGKMRIIHRDCFPLAGFGNNTVDMTYAMLGDVSYSYFDNISYDQMTVTTGRVRYPNEAVAFLQDNGRVMVAMMDWRAQTSLESEAFVVIGKNQLGRANWTTLHTLEVEGLRAGGQVATWRSLDGLNLQPAEIGFMRSQTGEVAEVGFDMPTGKNHTFYIKGDFSLYSIIAEATDSDDY